MEPFLYYLFNTYPELKQIMSKFDIAVRRILQDWQGELCSIGTKDCVQEVEQFLQTSGGRFLPVSTAPITEAPPDQHPSHGTVADI